MTSSTVVLQPLPKAVPVVTKWNSGLCHCCMDMSSCCYAFWCFPCFTCGTASKFGESYCLPLVDWCGPMFLGCTGFCIPPVTLSMRVALRYKYKIPGSICEDMLISCFCTSCSWCQMSREIEHRKMAAAAAAGVINQPTIINTVTAPIIVT